MADSDVQMRFRENNPSEGSQEIIAMLQCRHLANRKERCARINPYSSLLVIALVVLTACSPANSSTTVITEDPEPVATLTVALTPGINTPAITNSTLRPPDF